MKLHAVVGGLMLAGQKQAAARPIIDIPLPDELVLPLVDYRRELLEPRVRPGDRVAGGEPVATGVLTGTSGIVVAIEERPFMHPSGRSAPCVIVETDKKDDIAGLPPLGSLSATRLLEAGIQGMGGAGFAAADKLRAIAARDVSLLIINAAECEPGIACDAALMQSDADAVLQGIHQLAQLTGCRHCIIAIEETSQAAMACLRQAMTDKPRPDVELVPIPARYPSGAEATLVRLLSGIRLQAGERPTDHGILCLNVATAFACSEAVRGIPLHARLVTFGGELALQARNARVRFGTPLSHVLRHLPQCYPAELHDIQARPSAVLRAGGPLSGFELASAQAPVSATTNCVTVDRPQATPAARECIRCGQCADVCPAGLLPQQLYRYARHDDTVQLKRFSLSACITCGCCDLVCPSAIALTATFRHAQSHLHEQASQQREAARLAGLHEAREQRLHQQATEREAEQMRRRQQLDTQQDPVAAALARARARQRGAKAADPDTRSG